MATPSSPTTPSYQSSIHSRSANSWAWAHRQSATSNASASAPSPNSAHSPSKHSSPVWVASAKNSIVYQEASTIAPSVSTAAQSQSPTNIPSKPISTTPTKSARSSQGRPSMSLRDYANTLATPKPSPSKSDSAISKPSPAHSPSKTKPTKPTPSTALPNPSSTHGHDPSAPSASSGLAYLNSLNPPPTPGSLITNRAPPTKRSTKQPMPSSPSSAKPPSPEHQHSKPSPNTASTAPAQTQKTDQPNTLIP